MTKTHIGFWTLLCLVMGNMIGSGVFSLPASLAHYGSISLLGWAFTACGSLLIALVFSRLSQKIPHAGGPYAYCKKGLGDFMGFQVAWTYWISMWVGSAATVVMIVGYLSVFFPTLNGNPLWSFLTGLLVIWTLTTLNILSLKGSGRFQVVTTVLKVVPIIAVVFWGLPHFDPSHFDAFNISGKSHTSAFISTAMLTMWTFLGLESATIPSEHVKNPKRLIPLATLLGTLLVGVIYMVTQSAMIGLLPMEALQNTPAPFAMAASKLFGPMGATAIALGAIIAAAGSLNGFVLIQSQIPMAAAKDKLFPKIFGKTTAQGTPLVALLTTGTAMTIALAMNFTKSLVDQFTFLITLATLAALSTYLFSVVAEFILNLKEAKKSKRPLSLGSIALSMAAFAYSLWVIIGAGEEVVSYGSLLFLASTPLYGLIRWQHSKKK